MRRARVLDRSDTEWKYTAAYLAGRVTSYFPKLWNLMKKIALLLFVALLWTPSQTMAQLGIAAGMNFDEMSDISGDKEATFENATGYHVGLYYDLGAGPIALRIGAFYREVSDIEVDLDGIDGAFDLTMIDVPIDLRLNLAATPIITPYIFGGPVISIPSSSDDAYHNALESFAVSGNLGVGVSIKLGSMRLFPELRYVIGVSRFMKDEFEIGNISFSADEAQRHNSVMLRLGIGL